MSDFPIDLSRFALSSNRVVCVLSHYLATWEAFDCGYLPLGGDDDE